MNVIYHLRSFPKLSESFVLNEVHALVERGHQVAVFAFNDPQEAVTHSEFNSLGIPIRYANPLSSSDVFSGLQQMSSYPNLASNLRIRPRTVWRDSVFARQLLDFVTEVGWEPDIIHGHFASSMRMSAQVAASVLGIPNVVTCHANDIYKRDNRTTAQRVLSTADRVITVCESNRQFIKTELNVSSPIDVVPASINLKKFMPSQSTVDGRVLTVARLTEKKGLESGIKAMVNVIKSMPDVSYHIIGSGELRSTLEEQISSHDCEHRMSLLGRVPEEQLLSELDEAQVFLLPSIITSEGDRDATPVVLKEAMAMGTPCVSTDVCGIPEVVDHGENGLIVQPGDVDALSDAVTSILVEEERREQFGRNARKKAKCFDVDRTVRQLEESFREAIV